jgi:hypothetical protein
VWKAKNAQLHGCLLAPIGNPCVEHYLALDAAAQTREAERDFDSVITADVSCLKNAAVPKHFPDVQLILARADASIMIRDPFRVSCFFAPYTL